MKFLNNIFDENDYGKNLIKLFKICDFLQDKNINIVEKMIVNYIDYDDVNINDSFEFLELLFISNYDYVSIFYSILRKYEHNDIKFKFKQLTNTKLYEFCFDECIKYISIS